MRGRIEKALSGFYYVNVGQQVLQCRARGKFRREGTSPLVGDWVQVRELGGRRGLCGGDRAAYQLLCPAVGGQH